MNNNTEYELLTKSIYDALLQKEGLTIDVKHNVLLKGKATEHQIDVYWEYKIADTLFRVAIECKNYNSKVSIGKVRDFHSVLNDIGNIQGIIVSKNGFQSGAKKYAELYGINLKEIRPPQDEDWKGRIKNIILKIDVITTKIHNRKINFDEKWMRDNSNLPQDTVFKINDTIDNIWLIDDLGNKISNLHQLDTKLPTDMGVSENITHTYKFNNAYLKNSEGFKFKVLSIEYVYDIVKYPMPDITLDGAQTAKAIIKDALNGSIKFITNSGDVK